MRQSWTDDRLDDLVVRVDRGFEEVDRRFGEVERRLGNVESEVADLRQNMTTEFIAVRKEIKEGNETTQRSIEAVQRSIVHLTLALTSAIMLGFIGIVGLIATQL